MAIKKKEVRVPFAALKLKADYGDGDGATLNWSVRNGYPRITIFTDNKNNEGSFNYDKMITAPLDYMAIMSYIDMFQEVIDGPNDNKKEIDCYNTKYENGVKTNEIRLQGTAVIGKDKDGVMYIAAIEEGKRKIKFPLNFVTWYKLRVNGEYLTESQTSIMYAKSYVKVLDRIISRFIYDDTIHKNMFRPKRDDGTVDTTSLVDENLF